MAYDSKRKRIVLFGGELLDDTWEWDGSDWTRRYPSKRPPGLSGHAMAYDRARGVVVLCGGSTLLREYSGGWFWDGNNWSQIHRTCVPGRWGHAMAYDTAREEIVLFGGVSTVFGTFGDTYVWDGWSWTRRSTTGPSPRCGHSLAYDPRRRRVVLFSGGTRPADTWEWDGARWAQLRLSPSPAARQAHRAVCDTARGRMVMFSGGMQFTAGFHQDTWELTEVGWVQRQVSLSPVGRFEHAMAYDETRRSVVLFGGWNVTSGRLGGTWEFVPVSPARYETFGRGCSGRASPPTLTPAPDSYPWIDGTFEVQLSSLPPNQPALMNFGFSNTAWGPLTLPASLAAIGMPGCDLLVAPDIVTSVANVAGTATWSLPLPNDPGLVGRAFYNQGLILDPAANPLGAVVSNGGAGVVGAK